MISLLFIYFIRYWEGWDTKTRRPWNLWAYSISDSCRRKYTSKAHITYILIQRLLNKRIFYTWDASKMWLINKIHHNGCICLVNFPLSPAWEFSSWIINTTEHHDSHHISSHQEQKCIKHRPCSCSAALVPHISKLAAQMLWTPWSKNLSYYGRKSVPSQF